MATPATPAANGPGATIAANATVTFTCCSYSPAIATINEGESVTWQGSFSSHPLEQVDGPTSSTPVPGGFSKSSGTTFTHVFPTAGTYYYHCTLHGAGPGGMRGRVEVMPAASVPGRGDLTGIALAIAPNPALTGADVRFSLRHAMRVELAVYDLAGALVRRLHRGELPVGERRFTWDGKDARGREAPTGLYFVRLASADGRIHSKLVKLR